MHKKLREVIVMKVGKSVSLDFDDLEKVRKKSIRW